MTRQIAVEARAAQWAVTHNGGVLGFCHSEQEAVEIARSLRDTAAGPRPAKARASDGRPSKP